jgi:hypothetical protein
VGNLAICELLLQVSVGILLFLQLLLEFKVGPMHDLECLDIFRLGGALLIEVLQLLVFAIEELQAVVVFFLEQHHFMLHIIREGLHFGEVDGYPLLTAFQHIVLFLFILLANLHYFSL